VNTKEELLELVSQLRRRVEQGHESDFMVSPSRPAAPTHPPTVRAGRLVDKSGAAEPPPAISGPPVDALAALAAKIDACRACPLGEHRLKAVFGVGSPTARVMFIGEGPGYEEDHRGEPFVGKSGQLLDRILESIGLSRQTVYIANVVKCHPMKEPDPELRGNDRPPTPEETAACRGYLDEQIRLIEPRVLVLLGASALKALLGPGESITRARGQWRRYTPDGGTAVKVLPTYHPAALLRDPDLKKDVWTDMKALRAELENSAEDA